MVRQRALFVFGRHVERRRSGRLGLCAECQLCWRTVCGRSTLSFAFCGDNREAALAIIKRCRGRLWGQVPHLCCNRKACMDTSTAFLATFATIEKWLRRTANEDRSATFYQLVDRVAAKNRAVARYCNDLKEYADLRNAIIHERTDGHVIAEPNARAVADFERLCSTLLNPPTVIPMFQLSVKTLTTKDSVGEAITIMRDGSFSQLPILTTSHLTPSHPHLSPFSPSSLSHYPFLSWPWSPLVTTLFFWKSATAFIFGIVETVN